jgi:hypothetical protein
MSREAAEAQSATPLARLVTYAVAGIDPDIMGVGPINAIPKALKKAGMALADIDLFEFNEAFAAQALAVARHLEMDLSKVNVNGGAIALGHPLGATGAKLTTQLIHELRKRGGGVGMVTMCVGGGMGRRASSRCTRRSRAGGRPGSVPPRARRASLVPCVSGAPPPTSSDRTPWPPTRAQSLRRSPRQRVRAARAARLACC